ncbi:hypothetical protein ASPWEDRAFT_175640 [Aspergillus wentii DTO 134E9]|uniref:Uncharacterized protein n=1 Tax=Aspergillus wentii DTO 134E9 TaxID=1073089 RepID=A0A1L9RBR9_ASPWE|nr:uncharacterized protein ASPWEDRAFT_175640 [Aspergillus wentii DTO 134E9]KAI9934919.1 hypothetical protein MW887_000540 [Aspergillus wentii]OJJ32359.1 hypothetical protein ASPWEDRAFT_175640 [Aspergillus wentii DTO 134E9]
MSNSQLLDIEPGGENTQYESIREFTETPAKQTGQLGANSTHTTSQKWTTPDPDDGDTLDAIEDSELARTARLDTEIQGGNSSKDPNLETQDGVPKNRRQQGYGPGSGVGA